MAQEKLLVKDRDIVIPGQILAEGMDYLPSGKAVREDGNVISTVVGLANVKGRVLKVIPLTGKYAPKKSDNVIGEITEISKFGWKIDIKTAQDAEINIRDASTSFVDANGLTKIFNIGDTVLGNIIEVNQGRFVKLSTKFRPNGRLSGGIVIEVPASKIPRIIGREGSMIKMLKDETSCDLFVGQNGLVWIKGDANSVKLAQLAIDKICTDAHMKGLTEEIKKVLSDKKSKSTKEEKPKATKSKGGKSAKK